MRLSNMPVLAIGILLTTFALGAQTPQAPWRGAGPTPCVGADGGVLQCPPAAAGRRRPRRPPVRQQEPAGC